jgi:C4-dicarboxylate transporter DctM subunit
MADTLLGILGIATAVFLILLNLPVGFSFLSVGIAGLIYINGLNATLYTVGSTAFQWASDYTFAAIPLFLIMGEFAHTSGISHDLYEFGQRLVGRIPGGLAMATIGACGGFAALSGSSLATAAAMGSVALPQMKRIGYNISVATGTIAAGGTLGILIPPSIPFVIIGILTGTSISQLLIAGILPGMMMVMLYCSVLYIMCRIRPELGPRAQGYPVKEILAALVNVWPMLVIFGSIMGGIYLGICTPTEAAAVGAFGSFLFIFFKRQFKGRQFLPSLIQTGITATMMLTMLIGAMIFNIFLASTGLPGTASAWISSLGVNRYVILAIIMIIYLIMGCLMDSLAMVILSIPFFFPIITALEFSPILFGVLAVRAIEMGQITPPVGINVYIIKGIVPEVPIERIFRGILPFLSCDFISLPILIAIPQISLFLPTLMK